MTALEIIEKSKQFADELRAKLTDTNAQPASKQAYFMDNYEVVQKYMGALKTVIDSMQENGDEVDAMTADENRAILTDAQEIVTHLKTTIADFQQTLMINENVQESQTSAVLNEQTMQEAMTSNKTTQEIMQNMDAIAKSKQVPYNYALLCDGIIHLIDASTKDNLNQSINDIVSDKNYKSISLFQLSFTPVPLKKKTVLSV